MFLCIHKTDYASRKVTKYPPKKIVHKINFEKLASDDPRISDSNLCLIFFFLSFYPKKEPLWAGVQIKD